MLPPGVPRRAITGSTEEGAFFAIICADDSDRQDPPREGAGEEDPPSVGNAWDEDNAGNASAAEALRLWAACEKLNDDDEDGADEFEFRPVVNTSLISFASLSR